MLAEVHGKLSAESVDPVERSEDLLTDVVFGTLRHLPYDQALAAILQAVGVTASVTDLREAEVLLWPQIPWSSWPARIIEPDVLVVVGRQVVLFEAKLHSAFDTSYPDPGDSLAEGLHQLAIQQQAVSEWALGTNRELVTIVAVTAHTVPPSSDLERAAADAERLHLGRLPLVWLSWHRIGEVLDGLDGLRSHERRHVSDVLALLEHRGVRRVFTGFQMEDYWTVTAAQRVAGDRLYPQVRTFFDELTAVLHADDVGWSQPSYKGMWLGGTSTSVSKPRDWTRGYVGAPYWPTAWRTRSAKTGVNLAVYAMFDFVEPGLEIGLSIPGPNVTVAQSTWIPLLADLAGDLNELTGLEVVVDAGDLSRPTRVAEAGTVTEAWLQTACGLMVTTAHLRLRSRLPVAALTVQEAREAVGSLIRRLSPCLALWSALEASGHLLQEV